MKRLLKSGFIITLIIFFTTISYAHTLIETGDILNNGVKEKIDKIGNELFKKTGINLGVVALDKLDNQTFKEAVLSKIGTLKPPYVILALVKKEHKVDIFVSSNQILNTFDKQSVLSPYPSSGSILPILGSKKGDIYNAALLNGYGDIADRIADYYHVKLINGLGNSNRYFLDVVRLFIYGSVLLAIIIILYRKIKR